MQESARAECHEDDPQIDTWWGACGKCELPTGLAEYTNSEYLLTLRKRRIHFHPSEQRGTGSRVTEPGRTDVSSHALDLNRAGNRPLVRCPAPGGDHQLDLNVMIGVEDMRGVRNAEGLGMD